MAPVNGLRDPSPAPLLPNERVLLHAAGVNPDDYMALWVHPVPDERGLSVGQTDGGLTFFQALSVAPTAAFTTPSKLLYVQQDKVTLDVKTSALRLVIAKKSCEVDAIPDEGWEVACAVTETEDLPRTLRMKVSWRCDEPGVDRATFTTLTLYEAQAIQNRLAEAGIEATMRPLTTPSAPPTTDQQVQAQELVLSAADEGMRAGLLASLGVPAQPQDE